MGQGLLTLVSPSSRRRSSTPGTSSDSQGSREQWKELLGVEIWDGDLLSHRTLGGLWQGMECLDSVNSFYVNTRW